MLKNFASMFEKAFVACDPFLPYPERASFFESLRGRWKGVGHPGLWWELDYPLGDLMLFLHHLSKTNVMERSIVTIPFESLDEIRKCYHSNLNMKLLQ